MQIRFMLIYFNSVIKPTQFQPLSVGSEPGNLRNGDSFVSSLMKDKKYMSSKAIAMLHVYDIETFGELKLSGPYSGARKTSHNRANAT